MQEIRIAIIGYGFMGRAHSNAYLKTPKFFDLPAQPVLQVACGRNAKGVRAFAERFGWREWDTDWRRVVQRDDVDLVDICLPDDLHMPVAIAAAKAGKHILCEKPMARNVQEAERMYQAAQRAGICHMIGFNYRRVPAIALAKRMIEDGRVGRIYHFHAVYNQDWLSNPQRPFVWRNDRERAGAGALGDLGSHVVDLARYLVGEIREVVGAQAIFTPERPMPDGSGMRRVTADDATIFLARFADGAMGTFQVTRCATGCKNDQRIELHGTRGSLAFRQQRLNELQFHDQALSASEQGWRTMICTDRSHPYAAAWWPAGHMLGWEHTFVHEVRDLITAIATGGNVSPDFREGLATQLVLAAVQRSADTGQWVQVDVIGE